MGERHRGAERAFGAAFETRRPLSWKGKRLSQVDAFFVAYQDRSGILMQSGCEIELKGELSRDLLLAGLAHVVGRWPELGQRVTTRVFGLAWGGPPRADAMLHVGNTREQIETWRNTAIDPFEEPPFQLLWIPEGDVHLLAFRAHHAVADGESLFLVCREMASAVARRAFEPVAVEPLPPRGFSQFCRPMSLRMLRDMCRQHLKLGAEARCPQSLRLPLRSRSTGAIDVLRTSLRSDELDHVQRSARAQRVSTRCLFAAAWMKCLHRFCEERRDLHSSRVSLEVPISLRRGSDDPFWMGNYIAPLVVDGEAKTPLFDLSRAIQSRLMEGYRRRLHLSTPWLTSATRYLPWSLFRRLATVHGSTGFATSHFTCLRSPQDARRELRERAAGTLDVLGQTLWTPVCLEMGAALLILEWPEETEIFISYRPSALERQDAGRLAELLMQEMADALPQASQRLA